MGLEVHVFHCDGPPSIAPTGLGQHWVDTVARQTYISVGTATIADWILESGADITKLMDCASSVIVGDLVYQSATVNNFAIKAVDNTTLQPVIGEVVGKPTTTTCLVKLKGLLSVSVGRGKIYLSASGTYTTTAPTSGYLQVLGWSDGQGEIEINPALMRVKLA